MHVYMHVSMYSCMYVCIYACMKRPDIEGFLIPGVITSLNEQGLCYM